MTKIPKSNYAAKMRSATPQGSKRISDRPPVYGGKRVLGRKRG